MVRRQQERRTLNLQKATMLLACLVIAYLVWSTISALIYLGKADREATRTFEQLQAVSAQTLEQQKAMEYHATKAYVEKVAREDMLMSKKGDTVILFPKEQPAPEPIPSESEGLPRALSQFITWVKGWF
ncbi:septum formation initiator family protein [bacterium]|nr:septum formation initiator family protein [bacterium]